MKILHRRLMVATALAAALAVAGPLASIPAVAGPGTSASDPGFNPATGQINPGFDKKNPSSSQSRKVPPQAQALAALLQRESTANLPSIGDGPGAEIPAATTMRQETKDGQSTAGGPQATNAGNDVARNGSQGGSNNDRTNILNNNGTAPSDHGAARNAAGDKPPAATTGVGSSDAGNSAGTKGADMTPSNGQLAQDAAAPGPIGSTPQTMPSKLSARNDILDRVPIMAMPLPLSEHDRQRIYAAVMADKSQPTAGAETLAPADFLSTEQALNDTHALPDSLRDIPLLAGVHYVKAKDKVLLVTPSTRVVIDEITS